VPAQPPAAATAVEIEKTIDGVRIEVTYVGPVDGGEIGRYAARIYRQKPDQPAEILVQLFLDEVLDAESRLNYSDQSDPPTGTGYRAVIVDPIGRISEASEVAVLREGDNG
jgi:hypothetical protein